MGLDAALDVVPDRRDGQLAFEGTKGGFHFGKLDVLTPDQRASGSMGSRLVRKR